MSSIENEILREFLTALQNEGIPNEMVASLAQLLDSDRKLKPEDIAAAFVAGAAVGEE